MTKITKLGKNNQGFTLVELTIVLALIGIVMVMIVSFSTLAGNQTNSLTSQNQVLSDLDAFEDVFDTWVSNFDNEEYSFYSQYEEIYDGHVLYAANAKYPSGKAYKFFISKEGYVIGSTASNKILANTTVSIDELFFNITQNPKSGTLLIRCTVNYSVLNSTGTKTMSKSATYLKATHSACGIGDPNV